MDKELLQLFTTAKGLWSDTVDLIVAEINHLELIRQIEVDFGNLVPRQIQVLKHKTSKMSTMWPITFSFFSGLSACTEIAFTSDMLFFWRSSVRKFIQFIKLKSSSFRIVLLRSQSDVMRLVRSFCGMWFSPRLLHLALMRSVQSHSSGQNLNLGFLPYK